MDPDAAADLLADLPEAHSDADLEKHGARRAA